MPQELPEEVLQQLLDLQSEFEEGLLTEKGFLKKKSVILDNYRQQQEEEQQVQAASINIDGNSITNISHHHNSYSITSGFTKVSGEDQSFQGSSSHQQQPNKEPIELQKPLDPRVVNQQQANPDSFDTLGSILRHRGVTYQRESAIIVVDSKGKETVNISWEKLYLRAEKVAQQIRDKSGLYKNDRVCLIYQNVEIVDFTVALLGCFLAGVVAVPITLDSRIPEIIQIMNTTQSHLCLTSESVSKYLDKKVNNNSSSQIKWPKGLEFWKTTDFGSYHPQKKQDLPILQIPDLAYIEFVKSADGELRGVAISHKTIMNQMNSLSNILSSNPNFNNKKFKRSDISFTRNRNVMLNILDSRKSVGLIVGTLLNIFAGNLLIWTPSTLLDIAGLYANIITRFGVTILLNDYLSLKQVVYNYQSFPHYTRKFSKSKPPDFSRLKWCLIHTSIVDGEFHEILTNRWLKPLGCKDVDNVVAPLLSLSDFGGMVISMRDWLGDEHKLNTTLNQLHNDEDEDDDLGTTPTSTATHDYKQQNKLSEVLIDKKSLTTNTVKVVSDTPPSVTENFNSSEFVRIGSFGFPLPDATLAIVNPDTCNLSGVMEVGEIWIDSVSLPGGFWALPQATESMFHARCRDYEGVLDLEFLRTGLLGFTYNGKVYVLGLYEDRIRQRVTWIDKSEPLKENEFRYRYHYSDHLSYTLARAIPQKRVSDSSAFDVLINNEYLPVVVIETASATPSQDGSIDITELDLIATKSFIALERYHNVRPYCILILPPDALPRTIKSGIPGIANMSCKKYFLNGNLKSVYVKYNVKRAIAEIPRSKYFQDSIWSKKVSEKRYQSLKTSVDQYSGLDYRDTSIDDRTKKPLTDFKSIIEVLKWRSKKQPDELAYTTITRINTSKQSSWKKFDCKIAASIQLILEKIRKGKMKVGDHVVLMYTLSEEFVAILYACFIIGLIPIPINPIDSNRLNEDVPNFLKVLKDFNITTIFINNDVETILKNKPVSPLLKENPLYARSKLRNTSKLKTNSTILTFESKIKTLFKIDEFIKKNSTCLILLNWTEDGQRIATRITHQNILSLCKIMKETCQLESKNPVISCVRHTHGIGFIQSSLIGVYLGSSTYIISPLDFATNPSLFFLTLARYKVKDVYVTPQMLEYALKKVKSKEFNLERVKNLMIGYDSRPDVNLIKNIAVSFSKTKLNSSAISHIYSHNFNPMITSRSYLSFDAIDLWIDPDALRLGLISIVNPATNSNAIHLQDSGIVPVCTQIAIVNPETRQLCKVGEYGEIWICSEGNVDGTISGLNKNENSYEKYQFNARIKNDESNLSYVRTGDFGFLHNVSRVDKQTSIEFQPLFVLGPIADTFDVMGLTHFARDVENSIYRTHSDIKGSCVFKADGYVIAVVDSSRTKYLSSLVPVIFNKLLSDHYLIIDIVVFTKTGQLPYSRLGSIQRSTIVKKFTTKKLPVRAMYGISHGEVSMIKTVQQMERHCMSEMSSYSEAAHRGQEMGSLDQLMH